MMLLCYRLCIEATTGIHIFTIGISLMANNVTVVGFAAHKVSSKMLPSLLEVGVLPMLWHQAQLVCSSGVCGVTFDS